MGWDPAERFVQASLCHCLFTFNETLMFPVTSCGLGCLSLCVYEHEKISSSKNGNFCSKFHMVHRQVETDGKKKKSKGDQMYTFQGLLLFPCPGFSHSPSLLYSKLLLHLSCQRTGSISDTRCLTKKEK